VKSELIVARRAMNCEFSIAFPAGTPNALDLGCAALDEVDRLEDLLSFFRPDSQISRLNRGEPCHHAEVNRLLDWARRISSATAGAFDPRYSGKWNLGAIGKGYAIDAALRRIRPKSALMQGGQSSIAAVGTWTVALGDPPFARLKLTNQAIGTSGEQFQPGHILDPRTGRSARSPVLSATCIAPTATEADAFSTAFYVMGPAATRRFCQSNPRFGAILLLPDHQVEVIR
jgi:thiamine biosynthesis lipoprotein